MTDQIQMTEAQTALVGETLARIRAAELARDQSIEADAQLVAVLAKGRVPAGVRYADGRRVLVDAVQALSANVLGGKYMERLHARVAHTAIKYNLSWTAIGDGGDTYEPDYAGGGITGGAQPQLR